MNTHSIRRATARLRSLNSRKLYSSSSLTRTLPLLGLLVLGFASGVEAQALTIGLPNTARETDRSDATTLKDLVEGLSLGRLELHMSPCGDPTTCLRALQTGNLDALPVTTGDLWDWFPELQVLDLPYLFESDAVLERVLVGSFSPRMQNAISARLGLRLMAISTVSGWRTFASSEQPIRTRDDMRGLAIWTNGPPVEVDLITALGGSPETAATFPRSQLSTALANGKLEGITLPVTDLVVMGLEARIKYVTLDQHSPVLTLWLVHDDAYGALPATLQQLMQAGFDEFARLRRGLQRNPLTDAIRRFETSGGQVHTLTNQERGDFLLAAGAVRLDYVDAYGADWLVWLEAAIAEAENELGVTGGRDNGDR